MITINQMGTENRTADRILAILLKEPFGVHTATSIAKALNLTRQGVWKTLNRLAEDKLINLKPVGDAKTSAATIKLNWTNPVTEKTLSLLLTKGSLKQQRWRVNFAELENKVDFLIIYGSIINSPQEANDIDILGIVFNKNKFVEIEKIIKDIQKTQIKKIHAINFTPAEFRQELEKPTMAFIGAIKKGVVLFGQEKFIKFMKSIIKK